MSLTSKTRKENSNSHADQQIHGPMGLAPELSQLYDRDLTSELPSKLEAEAEQPSAVDALEDARETIAETDGDGPSQADIDENKRASWGQAPVDPAAPTHVADADWNRTTED